MHSNRARDRHAARTDVAGLRPIQTPPMSMIASASISSAERDSNLGAQPAWKFTRLRSPGVWTVSIIDAFLAAISQRALGVVACAEAVVTLTVRNQVSATARVVERLCAIRDEIGVARAFWATFRSARHHHLRPEPTAPYAGDATSSLDPHRRRRNRMTRREPGPGGCGALHDIRQRDDASTDARIHAADHLASIGRAEGAR